MMSCAQVSVGEILAAAEAKQEDTELAIEQLERLVFILHTLVSHRDGAKVTKPEAVCRVREKFKFVRFHVL